MYFEKLNSGAVSKRLSLKPLGTRNTVENEMTTPKRLFGETMPQSWLSTSKSASETANQTKPRKDRGSISANQEPKVRSAESSKAHEH